MTSLEAHQGQTSASLVIDPAQERFNDRQLGALRQLGIEEATEGDLAVFLHQCQRTGLDPFARQIYMVGRNQKDQRTNRWTVKYTIQTGIDGFRLIARRAVDQARESFGYEDTLWCGSDGVWRDIWLANTPPAAAKVTVIRNGQRYPAVALLSEYAGTTKEGQLTKMWREKPALMIAKCAEALALRKAFPQDLSGLYTSDEMQQSDRPTPAPEPTSASDPQPPMPGSPEDRLTQAAAAPAEPTPIPDDILAKILEAIATATSADDIDGARSLALGFAIDTQTRAELTREVEAAMQRIANPEPAGELPLDVETSEP